MFCTELNLMWTGPFGVGIVFVPMEGGKGKRKKHPPTWLCNTLLIIIYTTHLSMHEWSCYYTFTQWNIQDSLNSSWGSLWAILKFAMSPYSIMPWASLTPWSCYFQHHEHNIGSLQWYSDVAFFTLLEEQVILGSGMSWLLLISQCGATKGYGKYCGCDGFGWLYLSNAVHM